MKSVIATKKLKRLPVYFFVALILGTLQGILTPAYGEWQQYIIDDDINLAVNVDVADIDSDTELDLVVTNFGGRELLWYQNNFPEWIRHTIDSVAATFAWSGDINGNDTLDVVATLYSQGKMVWYENNLPDTIWTQYIIDQNTDNADFMLVADFDNDGTLDVVTAGSAMNGGDVVWYENHHPNWREHIIESGSGRYSSLNVTDIDGDGLLDLVATMVNANKVVWFRNENNGLSWTKYAIDDYLNNAWGINSGDINGDDKTDVVATTGGPYFAGNDVVWYENNLPDTIWTKHIIDANLPRATWPYVTDVDGDDTMDVVAGGYLGDDVVWYENNLPDTIWTKHIIDANLDGPRVFAVSDVDGDEINDVIVPALGRVVWYKNPYTTGICVYVPGDCDHNGTPLELGDVIAMIGMYRGSVTPPYECSCPPHGDNFTPTADPNGNCVALELGDVVTEIAAYRGTGTASGCEDCPGTLRLIPGSRDEPTVMPRLKSKVKIGKRSVSE